MGNNPLSINYQDLINSIANTANSGNRFTVPKLLAVSKRQSADKIIALYHNSNNQQLDFAENYLQEALDKQKQLTDLPIIWHFIGHIQSRKAREIGNKFSWVHTISSLLTAEKISHGAQLANNNINACIQINTSNEISKSGICFSNQEEIFALAEKIISLPNITLRGLMSIPASVDKALYTPKDFLAEQRKPFAQLAALLKKLQQKHPEIANNLDTLSMGMSDDYQAAILEGASIIRVGTLLFGKR